MVRVQVFERRGGTCGRSAPQLIVGPDRVGDITGLQLTPAAGHSEAASTKARSSRSRVAPLGWAPALGGAALGRALPHRLFHAPAVATEAQLEEIVRRVCCESQRQRPIAAIDNTDHRVAQIVVIYVEIRPAIALHFAVRGKKAE